LGEGVDDLTDQTLGKYRILDEIGSGGLATGYHPEDTYLGRQVTLKMLESLLIRDEAFVERFQREARAA
jgi:serine/threonine-protein kinase